MSNEQDMAFCSPGEDRPLFSSNERHILDQLAERAHCLSSDSVVSLRHLHSGHEDRLHAAKVALPDSTTRSSAGNNLDLDVTQHGSHNTGHCRAEASLEVRAKSAGATPGRFLIPISSRRNRLEASGSACGRLCERTALGSFSPCLT